MDNPAEPLDFHSKDAEPDGPNAEPVRHPIRVGTVVWGAVIATLALLIILSSQLRLELDAGLTAMWVLLGAGVAMVAGGAVNLLRRRRS